LFIRLGQHPDGITSGYTDHAIVDDLFLDKEPVCPGKPESIEWLRRCTEKDSFHASDGSFGVLALVVRSRLGFSFRS